MAMNARPCPRVGCIRSTMRVLRSKMSRWANTSLTRFASALVELPSSLIRHNRTGEVDHWPVHVAVCALVFFFFGLMFTAIEALT